MALDLNNHHLTDKRVDLLVLSGHCIEGTFQSRMLGFVTVEATDSSTVVVDEESIVAVVIYE